MRKLALVVDDVEMNREILSDMLEGDFDVAEAENGEAALQIIESRLDELCAVLLDLVMPVKGGLEVLEVMYANGWNEKVPVLIISSEDSADVEQRCFEHGVYDFIHKPFNRMLVKSRVKNAAALYGYKGHLEEMVAEQTERLLHVNTEIIELLGNVVEARNMESGLHIKRVKGFARILAECLSRRCPEYGLTPAFISQLESASALHDVGKIMIPDGILLKPGKLTPMEYEIMKTHTVRGCEILDGAWKLWDEDYFRLCYDICRHHHEKWDGRGYPDGIAGDAIPISAQIVSVADCYDALVTERVYKAPFPPDVAYNMILGGECGQFNPKLMECLTECREEFERFVRKAHEAEEN